MCITYMYIYITKKLLGNSISSHEDEIIVFNREQTIFQNKRIQNFNSIKLLPPHLLVDTNRNEWNLKDIQTLNGLVMLNEKIVINKWEGVYYMSSSTIYYKQKRHYMNYWFLKVKSNFWGGYLTAHIDSLVCRYHLNPYWTTVTYNKPVVIARSSWVSIGSLSLTQNFLFGYICTL